MSGEEGDALVEFVAAALDTRLASGLLLSFGVRREVATLIVAALRRSNQLISQPTLWGAEWLAECEEFGCGEESAG